MLKATSIKGKFYPLQYDEWLRACQELTPAAKDVLYLVRTLDPYSDGVEISAAEIAKQLSTDKRTVHRSTVSRAFKELDAKGFIDLELIKAYVTVKPLGIHCCDETACCDDATALCDNNKTLLDDNERCDDATSGVMTQQPHNIDRARADTIKTSNTNLKTTADKKVVAVELKKVEPEQDPQGSYQEDEEIFLQLRRLGIKTNLTIKKIIVAHRPNVANAIAHLKERIFSGESFKNLEGAFVAACTEGAKPERLINPPIELPQPDESQWQELKKAKSDGKIRSYDSYPYNGGRTVLVDDCAIRQVIPWWEYLRIDGFEEFEEVEF